MPKIIPKQELDQIANAVAGFPEGAPISKISEVLGFELSNRMLQGRLSRLEKEGRIYSSGARKGKRYFPVISNLDENELIEGVIPISASAREIRHTIKRPLSSRSPVGYNPEFLQSYVPNKSNYLSREISLELGQIGKVGVSGLPAGTYVRQLLHRLLIDLSWNSSRLEGNTYSLLETERLIELGESAEGRGAEETQMILNHKGAIEMLADDAEEIGFNRYTICNLHALLSDNMLSDPGACGRLRARAVGIAGSVFLPLEVPQQIEDRFLEILEKADAINNPFEQAFFVMVHLPYLQPFEDVNKRVSRLSANIPFIRHNLCPLSFIDVAQSEYVNGLIGVYELNRVEYLRDIFVWAYQRSAARYSAVLQSLGEPDPFRLRYRAEIAEFVREVIKQKIDKPQAAKWIEKHARAKINSLDQSRFIEVVETELMNLHEGNIARFRLRPNEFNNWQKKWK